MKLRNICLRNGPFDQIWANISGNYCFNHFNSMQSTLFFSLLVISSSRYHYLQWVMCYKSNLNTNKISKSGIRLVHRLLDVTWCPGMKGQNQDILTFCSFFSRDGSVFMRLCILVASWPLSQTGSIQSFCIKLEFLQFIENTFRTKKFSSNNNTRLQHGDQRS